MGRKRKVLVDEDFADEDDFISELRGGDCGIMKPENRVRLRNMNSTSDKSGELSPKTHSANERERARMRVLSKAFGKLKTTLPWVPPDTKLSKLDTLRLAASYIAHLRHLLETEGEGGGDGGDRGTGEPTAPERATALTSLPVPPCPPDVEPRSRKSSPAQAIHPITLTWPYAAHGRLTLGGSTRPRDH